MEDIIKIQDLWYWYPQSKEPALKGVNLVIHKGEFISIIGPTGAGKSTLCFAINGLIPHFFGGTLKGSIEVAGYNTKVTPVSLLSSKVGMVFQEPESQLFSMTVEEEIAFGPENFAVPPCEIRDRVDWALNVVRMEKYRDRSPFSLSGGQKQRVAIAAALAMLPEILVLDEPVSGLDPIGKTEVFQVLDDLRNDRNITIALVEHEVEEIARFSDRVVLMDYGQVLFENTPFEVFKNVDKLREVGVRAPQVCELSSLIRTKMNQPEAHFITISQALDYLNGRIGKRFTHQHHVFQSDRNETDRNSSRRSSCKTAPCIIVENLTHVYEGGAEALKNVNLSITEGEFIAIVGQNGSGKTTLVKHFNGLLKPTKGRVVVKGADTKDKTVAELAKTVGYLFQNPDHQIFETSVENEVAFGPKNMGLSESEISQRMKEALEMVGLEDYREAPPTTLGLGQRRLVTLASIIAMKPPIIVLDEPTTGIDWKDTLRLISTVKELNKSGHTIVLITHDMRVVALAARRVVVMCEGKILLDGPTRWVFSQPEVLKEAFISPPQITVLAQSLAAFPTDILTVEEFYHCLQEVV